MLRIIFLSTLLSVFGVIEATAQLRDSVVATDSSANVDNVQNGDEEVVDEETDVFLFGIFYGAMVVAIAVGVGAVLVVVVVFVCLLALVAAGIISVSTFAAWRKKSVGSGIRTAVCLTASGGGIIFGTGVSWLAQAFWKWSDTPHTVWLTGVIGGALGGAIAGFIVLWTAKKAWALIRHKLQRLR